MRDCRCDGSSLSMCDWARVRHSIELFVFLNLCCMCLGSKNRDSKLAFVFFHPRCRHECWRERVRRSSRRRCCFGVVKFQCCCHKLKAVKFLCYCYKNVFRIRLLIWTLVPIGARRILERSGQNSNDCENARKTNIGPTRIKRYRVAHVDVRIAPVDVRIWWCSQRGWGT